MTHLGKICDMDTIIVNSDRQLQLNLDFAQFVDGTTVTFDGQLHVVSGGGSPYPYEWVYDPCVVQKSDGKWYKLIATWGEHGLADGCEWLGLPCAEWFFTGACKLPDCETWDYFRNNIAHGEPLSSGNANWLLEPGFRYLQANFIANLWADSEGGLNSGAKNSVWAATNFQQNKWNGGSGVYTPLTYRPEIILENDGQSGDLNTYIQYINDGKYSTTEGGSQIDDYAAPNDSSYSPARFSNTYIDPFSIVEMLETIGHEANDRVNATQNREPADSNEQTWKSALLLPLSYRRDQDPATIAYALEALLKGAVGYVRKQTQTGDWEEKKAIYVTSADLTNAQVELVEPQFTSTINGPFQLAPLVCACNEIFGRGRMEIDLASGSTYMEYYANGYADAFSDADVAYAPFVGVTENEWQEYIQTYATTTDGKEHATKIQFVTGLPCDNSEWPQFGSNSTRRICNGLFNIECAYSAELKKTAGCYMPFSCLLWDFFEHIEEWGVVSPDDGDTLQSAMSWWYSIASLPNGVELSNIPVGYSRRTVVDMLAEGLRYARTYAFSDSLYYRCQRNADTHGLTKYDDINYKFNSIFLSDQLDAYTTAGSIPTLFGFEV